MRSKKEIIEIRDILNNMLRKLSEHSDLLLYKHYETQRDMLDFVLGKDFTLAPTSDNKDCAVTVAEQPSPKPDKSGFAQS